MTLDYLYCLKHFKEIDNDYPDMELMKEVKQKNFSLDQKGWVEYFDESNCTICNEKGLIIVKYKQMEESYCPISASVRSID